MDPWSISQFLRTLCCFFFGGGLTWPCGIVGNCAGHNHQVLFYFFHRSPFLLFSTFTFLLCFTITFTFPVGNCGGHNYFILNLPSFLFIALFLSVSIWPGFWLHYCLDSVTSYRRQNSVREFFLGNGSGKRICAIPMQLLKSWGLPILS